MPLTIDEYQARAQETAIYPGKGEIMGLAYVMLGLGGEAGECQNKCKKILRDFNGHMTDEMRVKIREELGGTFWYLAACASEIGVPLSEIAQENLDILAKRKEEGKIKGSGDDRGTVRDGEGKWHPIHDVDPGQQDPAPIPPVDRTQRVTTSGKPATMEHPAPAPINPKTGQHEAYWVLSEEERGKGFVRPVRRSYIHGKCGTLTSMGGSIAETFARDPKFYSHTFCCACRDHLPVDEFVWDGTTQKVGS